MAGLKFWKYLLNKISMKHFLSLLFFTVLLVNSSVFAVTREELRQNRFLTLIRETVGYTKLKAIQAAIERDLIKAKEYVRHSENCFFESARNAEEKLLREIEKLGNTKHCLSSSASFSFLPINGFKKGECFVSLLRRGELRDGWLPFLDRLYDVYLIKPYDSTQEIEEQLSRYLFLEKKDDGNAYKKKKINIQYRKYLINSFLHFYGHRPQDMSQDFLEVVETQYAEVNLLTLDLVYRVKKYFCFKKALEYIEYLNPDGKVLKPISDFFDKRKTHLRLLEKKWVSQIESEFDLKRKTEGKVVSHNLLIPKIWKRSVSDEQILCEINEFASDLCFSDSPIDLLNEISRNLARNTPFLEKKFLSTHFSDFPTEAQKLIYAKICKMNFFNRVWVPVKGVELEENWGIEGKKREKLEGTGFWAESKLTQEVLRYCYMYAIIEEFQNFLKDFFPDTVFEKISDHKRPEVQAAFPVFMSDVLEQKKLQYQQSIAQKDCDRHRTEILSQFPFLAQSAYYGFLSFFGAVEKKQIQVERKADWKTILTVEKNILIQDLKVTGSQELLDALDRLSQDFLVKREGGFQTFLEFEGWVNSHLFVADGVNKKKIPFLKRLEYEYFSDHEECEELQACFSEAFEENQFFKKNLLGDEVSFFDSKMIHHMYGYVHKKLFLGEAERFEKELANALTWDDIDSQSESVDIKLQDWMSENFPHVKQNWKFPSFVPDVLIKDSTGQEFLYQINQFYAQLKDEKDLLLSNALQKYFSLPVLQYEAEEMLEKLLNVDMKKAKSPLVNFRFFELGGFCEKIEAYFALKRQRDYICHLLVLN
jgi:hypothetical protein